MNLRFSPQMRHEAPFRHSLPVPDGLFRAPLYVTGAGWERIKPMQPYPLPDTTLHGFRWEDGRILPEFCVSVLTQGTGHLETLAGRQIIPAGRAFFFRPGEWHRHRPARASGWTNHWLHFNGDLPHDWMRDAVQETSRDAPRSLPPIYQGRRVRPEKVLARLRLIQVTEGIGD